MTRATITIDLGSISSDDLVDELTSRSFEILEESRAMSRRDDIYNLYRDFIEYDSNKMSPNTFRDRLIKFFDKHNIS